MGAGAVQANMAVFGAEQMQRLKFASRYFDKYVVATNIGGVIAVIFIPHMANDQNYIALIVAAAALALAAIFFLIGCRYYIHINPYDTVMTKCIPVVFSACQSWCRYRKERQTNEHREASEMERPSWTFLDFAKIPFRGRFHGRIVDNVKTVSSALAMFVILIPFWLIYNQVK